MDIVLRNIRKSFDDKQVLKGISLNIKENTSVAILGDSGTGKSTLLNIIALFEMADEGELFIDGVNVKSGKFSKMLYWRQKLGYIFQNYALVDNLNVEKNLELAMKYIKQNRKQKKILIQDTLQKVGLAGKEKSMVYTLSGGEQQRLAIARLMIKPCELILADEPTGALDIINRDYIIKLLKDLQDTGRALVIVTHDKEVASVCDTVIEL